VTRRCAAAVGLVLGICAPACAAPPSLLLTYALTSLGVPVMTLEFSVTEADDAYRIEAVIRSSGIADFVSRFVLHAESVGARSEARLRPRTYASNSTSRWRRRQTRMKFGPEGGVVATVEPPEDPAHARPGEDILRDSLDPLSGILQLGHIAARDGRCAARIPIFDGRRRYDLVFTDEPAALPGGDRGGLHCKIAVLKLAGFSGESDEAARVDHAEAWLASVRPGAPLLPVRVEFAGTWGPIRVSLVDPARGGAENESR
jgi:hypothetical protein